MSASPEHPLPLHCRVTPKWVPPLRESVRTVSAEGAWRLQGSKHLWGSSYCPGAGLHAERTGLQKVFPTLEIIFLRGKRRMSR